MLQFEYSNYFILLDEYLISLHVNLRNCTNSLILRKASNRLRNVPLWQISIHNFMVAFISYLFDLCFSIHYLQCTCYCGNRPETLCCSHVAVWHSMKISNCGWLWMRLVHKFDSAKSLVHKPIGFSIHCNLKYFEIIA